jgi:hypothetical protein
MSGHGESNNKCNYTGRVPTLCRRWQATQPSTNIAVGAQQWVAFRIAEEQPMEHESYEFIVEAEDQAMAGRGAIALADVLREADGVLEANRRKADETTMDLGVIVSIIATSEATLAIARGVAAWLRARRGATIRIEKNGKSGSIKAAVEGIDAEAAVRITEIIRMG